MKKCFFLFTLIFLSLSSLAQPLTPYAPNVIVHDIDGVKHDLYEYLNQDRKVILEFYNSTSVASINSRPGVQDLYDMFGLGGDLSHAILSIDMDSLTSTESTFRDNYTIQNAVLDSIQSFKAYNADPTKPMFIVICPDRLWKVRYGSIFDDETYITSMSNQCASLSTLQNDGKIFKYFSNPQYCEGETTAQFYLQNYSMTNNLVSAKIEAREAGNLRGTTNWTGCLKPYEIDTVSVDLTGIAGYDFIDFEIKEVNGLVDDYTTNNSFTQLIREGIKAGVSLKIEYHTDFHPEQNDWYIIEGNSGDTVLHSFGLSLAPDTYYEFTPSLETFFDGCFEFYVDDTFGDGILNGVTPEGDAQGSFIVTTNLEDTLLNYIGFERLTSRKFYLEKTLDVPKFDEIQSPSIVKNPMTEQLQIEGLSSLFPTLISVVDIEGKIIYSQSVNQSTFDINVSAWDEGIYFVELRNELGMSILKAIK